MFDGRSRRGLCSTSRPLPLDMRDDDPMPNGPRARRLTAIARVARVLATRSDTWVSRAHFGIVSRTFLVGRTKLTISCSLHVHWRHLRAVRLQRVGVAALRQSYSGQAPWLECSFVALGMVRGVRARSAPARISRWMDARGSNARRGLLAQTQRCSFVVGADPRAARSRSRAMGIIGGAVEQADAADEARISCR